jgi:hypothetical protein
MDFKKPSLKSILLVLIPGVLLISFLAWEFFPKTDSSVTATVETLPPVVKGAPLKAPSMPTAALPQMSSQPASGTGKEEDTAIQEQLDRDRKQQKQTKDLKIKLEQTNLELEQEKALAEINKLKKENTGAFNEPTTDGQNNFPEIKVDYIGGNSIKKEAILSIGGASYQVKEKSSPTANIQIVSISDSSVTLHFSAPEELTKTIDYKPE